MEQGRLGFIVMLPFTDQRTQSLTPQEKLAIAVEPPPQSIPVLDQRFV